MMQLLITVMAPNGATSVAGAYAYAKKLPVSPGTDKTILVTSQACILGTCTPGGFMPAAHKQAKQW
jgi:hypothetical protein